MKMTMTYVFLSALIALCLALAATNLLSPVDPDRNAASVGFVTKIAQVGFVTKPTGTIQQV